MAPMHVTLSDFESHFTDSLLLGLQVSDRSDIRPYRISSLW